MFVRHVIICHQIMFVRTLRAIMSMYAVILRLLFPVYPSFCQFTILSNVSKEKQLFCGLIIDIFLNVPIMRFSVNQDCGFVVFDLVNK